MPAVAPLVPGVDVPRLLKVHVEDGKVCEAVGVLVDVGQQRGSDLVRFRRQEELERRDGGGKQKARSMRQD